MRVSIKLLHATYRIKFALVENITVYGYIPKAASVCVVHWANKMITNAWKPDPSPSTELQVYQSI